MRQTIRRQENRFTIIDDTYNASPDSMRASLEVLCHMETKGRRIAVLGDMFELGEDSEKYHSDVGEFAASLPIDELVVVGNQAKAIRRAAQARNSEMKTYEFSDNEETAMYLLATLMPEDIVLVKGSNGMHMKEIVNLLME